MCFCTCLETVSTVSAAASMPVMFSIQSRVEELELTGEGSLTLTRRDDIGAHVLEARLDLALHKVSGHDVDAFDARRVLHRQGRRRRHGVAAVRGENLLARLEPAVSAGARERIVLAFFSSLLACMRCLPVASGGARKRECVSRTAMGGGVHEGMRHE